MKQLLLSLILFFPTTLAAQELHTFSNGEVADAEKINENFESLDSKVADIETRYSTVMAADPLSRGWRLVEVDCTKDANALRNSAIDILTGRDNVHVKMSGDCIGSEADGITIPGKRIFLDGGRKYDGDGYAGECESITTLRHAETGRPLQISIFNASTLLVDCITFSGGANLAAYGNSYIKTEVGVNADESGWSVFLRGHSVYRTFHAPPPYLTAMSGSTIEIGTFDNAPIGLSQVSLLDSRLVCVECSGYIETIELSDKSVASIMAFSELRVDSVRGSNESTFILRDLGNPDAVGLGTISAYQGSSIILENQNCTLAPEISLISADSRLIRYSDSFTPCEN